MEADFYREKRRENKTGGGDWMVGKLWETDIRFLYAFQFPIVIISVGVFAEIKFD